MARIGLNYTKYSSLKSLINEIEELLGEEVTLKNAIKMVIKLKIDFAHNTLEKEATIFKWDYNHIATQERQGRINIDQSAKMYRDLIRRILDYCDEIENHYYLIPNPQPKNPPEPQLSDESKVVFYGENIVKEYNKQKSKNFRLNISKIQLNYGQITALFSKNGYGKTTLLKIVARELAETSGKIKYPALIGQKQKGTYSYTIKKQIAYIPQTLPEWQGSLLENLRFSAAIHGIRGEENEKIVKDIISFLDLEDYQHSTWKGISGGYRTRFALAKALVWKPKLLILDEPLANLDINAQLVFLQDLRSLVNSEMNPTSIIISSQNLYEVENVADKLIFIDQYHPCDDYTLVELNQQKKENIFELQCELSKRELQEILSDISGKQIDFIVNLSKYSARTTTIKCNVYILRTPKDLSLNDLLKIIIDNNVPITYIRDISESIRPLFFIN